VREEEKGESGSNFGQSPKLNHLSSFFASEASKKEQNAFFVMY
jgi:hypothetical protein